MCKQIFFPSLTRIYKDSFYLYSMFLKKKKCIWHYKQVFSLLLGKAVYAIFPSGRRERERVVRNLLDAERSCSITKHHTSLI